MGKGSGAGGARGGGGGGGKVISEDTMSMSSIQGRKGYDKAEKVAGPIANNIKPGEKVIIERTYKDGRTETMTITAKTTSKTYRDGSKKQYLGGEVKDTYYATYTSDDLFSGPYGGNNRDSFGLISHMRLDSSKVRSVKVTYKGKGKK